MKVVFDFGGVLFDWRPADLLRHALPHRVTDEHTAAHWVREVFQAYGGDWGEFDRGAVGTAELVERICARTGLAREEMRAIVDAVPGKLQPIPETVQLLGRLRASGVPLHFLSNMPLPYADHLERTHDFISWFDSGIFSGRVLKRKPDADIFELAASHFGAKAEELVFLDDHPPNIEAAQAAGWRAVHFTDASSAERSLRQHGWGG